MLFIANGLGATTTTTSFTIQFPGAIQVGDLLILEYVHRGQTNGTFSGDGGTGWTLKHKQFFGAGSPQDFSAFTWWKIATAADISSPQRYVTVSGLINSCAGIMTAYRYTASLGSPDDHLNDAVLVSEENASGNETQAGITTTTAGAFVILVVAHSPDVNVTGGTSANCGAMTLDAELLSTGGTDTSIAHWRVQCPMPQATGAFSWAIAPNQAGGSWAYAITPVVRAATTASVESQDTLSSGGTVADSTRTGTAAVVEAADRSSLKGYVDSALDSYDVTPQATIGDVSIAATVSAVEQSDIVSASTAITVTASVAAVEAADRAESAVGVLAVANASITESQDAINAAGGTALFADAAVVEGADRVAADATSTIGVTSALLEGQDQAASSVAVAVVGDAAFLEANDVISAAASLTANQATAAILEAVDAGSSKGYVDSFLDSYDVTPQFTVGAGVTANAVLLEPSDFLSSDGAVLVTAAAAITERADLLSSDAGVLVVGAFDIAEQIDVLAAGGGTALFVDAALIEAADTLAFDGSVTITAAAPLIEQVDAVSGSVAVTVVASAGIVEQSDGIIATAGSAVFVDAAIIEGADLASSDATVTVSVAAALIERADVSSSDGAVAVSATVAFIEQGDVLNGAGSVQGLEANLAVTEAIDRGAAGGYVDSLLDSYAVTPQLTVGTGVFATVAFTEARDQVSSDGAVTGDITHTGTANIIEAPDFVASIGTVQAFAHDPGHITRLGQFGVGLTKQATFAPKIGSKTADAGITEGADAITVSATVAIAATSAILEQQDRLASGVGVAITASAAIVEQRDRVETDGGTSSFVYATIDERADAVSSAGTVLVTGTFNVLEAPDTLSGSFLGGLTVSASIREGEDRASSNGAVSVSASVSVLEAADIVVSSVGVSVVASSAIVEDEDRLGFVATTADIFGDAEMLEAQDTLHAIVSTARPVRVTGSDRGRRHAAGDAKKGRVSGATSAKGTTTGTDGI